MHAGALRRQKLNIVLFVLAIIAALAWLVLVGPVDSFAHGPEPEGTPTAEMIANGDDHKDYDHCDDDGCQDDENGDDRDEEDRDCDEDNGHRDDDDDCRPPSTPVPPRDDDDDEDDDEECSNGEDDDDCSTQTPTSTSTPPATATVTPGPTEEPTSEPTEEPTAEPTDEPTPGPTEEPTETPTEEPTPVPTPEDPGGILVPKDGEEPRDEQAGANIIVHDDSVNFHVQWGMDVAVVRIEPSAGWTSDRVRSLIEAGTLDSLTFYGPTHFGDGAWSFTLPYDPVNRENPDLKWGVVHVVKRGGGQPTKAELVKDDHGWIDWLEPQLNWDGDSWEPPQWGQHEAWLQDEPAMTTQAETETEEPEQAVNNTYTVKSGETLSGIAAQYNTTVSALAQVNGINDPNFIVTGQVLTLPAAVVN